MQPTPKLRVLSDRIPWVLVFVYFYRGLRKYGRKAHTSGLHRDINVPRNFLSSRRLQKPRERTRRRTGPGAGRPPTPLGRPPRSCSQTRPTLRTKLHRTKGSRIIIQSMSVWSNGSRSLEGTIKPDPLAPGGKQVHHRVERSPRRNTSPLNKISFRLSIQCE